MNVRDQLTVVNGMFGSPHSSPFRQSRPPSNTPSLLSILRKHEQGSSTQSQSSGSPEFLGNRLATLGLNSPNFSPSPRTSPSLKSESSSRRTNGLIRHRHRQHIYHKAHQAKVKDEREQARHAMILKAYESKKRQGYQSSMEEFQGYLSYFDRIKDAVPHDPNKVKSPLSVKDDTLRRALSIAKASMQERKPINFDTSSLDVLQRKWRDKDAKIEEQLHPKPPPLPTSLPAEDENEVKALLGKRGIIAKYAREAVEDKDIVRLRPGQWLNDEIINFYGAMILGRSESCKENISGSEAGKPLKVHYFSTFFWSKLLNEGYEKGRLAKWTKKIDIFSKDVILIPVNHRNAHWTAAAINFRRKRIESYDSMGMAKDIVFQNLRKYLDAEHRNKKKKSFDYTGWEDYAPDEITPQQENGYDCGVFTCQFLESLSRGDEIFRFTQQDMPYLRRRMVWEIGHTDLRGD